MNPDYISEKIFRDFHQKPFIVSSEMKEKQIEEERYIHAILKDSHFKSLAPIKENITEARKPKMRLVQHYLCDCCDKSISKPSDGYVVQGNIFVADPQVKGGLIGDNFPTPDEKNLVSMDAVKQTVLCRDCFCKSLNLPVVNSVDTNVHPNKDYLSGYRDNKWKYSTNRRY
jgi:hypothetical protein